MSNVQFPVQNSVFIPSGLAKKAFDASYHISRETNESQNSGNAQGYCSNGFRGLGEFLGSVAGYSSLANKNDTPFFQKLSQEIGKAQSHLTFLHNQRNNKECKSQPGLSQEAIRKLNDVLEYVRRFFSFDHGSQSDKVYDPFVYRKGCNATIAERASSIGLN